MRDFMIQRSLRGARGFGDLTIPGLTVPPPAPTSSLPPKTLVSAPRTAVVTTVTRPKAVSAAPGSGVKTPSGSGLVTATVRDPRTVETFTPPPSSPLATAGSEATAAVDEGVAARDVASDPTLDTSSPTIYGSGGATFPALDSFWDRYGWWALLGAGASALTLFWFLRRRR